MDLFRFPPTSFGDYFLLVIAIVIVINLILIVRALSSRGNRKTEVVSPTAVSEPEIESVLSPPETELVSEEVPKLEAVAQEAPIVPLQGEEQVEVEIKPIPDGETLELEIASLPEKEVKTEIRPVLEEMSPDSCEYCSLFKDLNTMVCPNCGRPLNIRIIREPSR